MKNFVIVDSDEAYMIGDYFIIIDKFKKQELRQIINFKGHYIAIDPINGICFSDEHLEIKYLIKEYIATCEIKKVKPIVDTIGFKVVD